MKSKQFIKLLKTKIEPMILENYPNAEEWEVCRYEVYQTLYSVYTLCSSLVPSNKLYCTMLQVITISIINGCNIPNALRYIWEEDEDWSAIKTDSLSKMGAYFIRKILEIYYVEMVLDTASQKEKAEYVEALVELSKQMKILDKKD